MLLALVLLFVVAPEPARAETVRVLEGVINMNTASPDELQFLSGIGPTKVRNILAYRKAHPFRTVEELVRIKGIGRKMVRRLRLHLAVSGPTTAQLLLKPRSVSQPGAGVPLPNPPGAIWGGRPLLPAPPVTLRRPPAPFVRATGSTTRPPPRPTPASAPRTPFPRAPANHCEGAG